MNNVNKTLYIPLYGKACVSKKGILLQDKKAEELWTAEGFPLKGKAKSKWLAYYMGMRSSVFDQWLTKQMQQFPDAVVLHIGCGMDSRVERVGTFGHLWYDVDFPEVIRERKRYFDETIEYFMIGSDAREKNWLEEVHDSQSAIVVMEGLSMYMPLAELRKFLSHLSSRFTHVQLLMDCYTSFAAKATKYKNPINEVGVTVVHGIDEPALLEQETGFTFLKEHELTPESKINELTGTERMIFKKVFAGRFSKKLYRLYEFSSTHKD